MPRPLCHQTLYCINRALCSTQICPNYEEQGRLELPITSSYAAWRQHSSSKREVTPLQSNEWSWWLSCAIIWLEARREGKTSFLENFFFHFLPLFSPMVGEEALKKCLEEVDDKKAWESFENEKRPFLWLFGELFLPPDKQGPGTERTDSGMSKRTTFKQQRQKNSNWMLRRVLASFLMDKCNFLLNQWFSNCSNQLEGNWKGGWALLLSP